MKKKMFLIFGMVLALQCQAHASVLDEMRDLYREVKRSETKNGGLVLQGLECAAGGLVCCSVVFLPFGANMIYNATKRNSANRDCRSAKESIYEAKHFLKEIEELNSKLIFTSPLILNDHEAQAKWVRKHLSKKSQKYLAEISNSRIDLIDLIEFIHEENQKGMDNLIATHPLTKTNHRGYDGYSSPNYIALIKDYLFVKYSARLTGRDHAGLAEQVIPPVYVPINNEIRNTQEQNEGEEKEEEALKERGTFAVTR